MDITICFFKVLAQSVFLGFASYLIVRFFLKRTLFADFVLAALVVFMTGAVTFTAVLGAFSRLHWPHLLMIVVMVFLVCVMILFNRVVQAGGLFRAFLDPEDQPNPEWAITPFVLTLASVGLVLGLLLPPIAHDVMTYHLFFPARWIQEGRLFLIPTVFGDFAPTYAPGNLELTAVFWALPCGKDTLARVAQFPFLLMGATAVFGLARRRGLAPGQAMVPAGLAVLTPVLFRQGFSAEADLAMAATFAAALYFLDHYRETPSISNAMLFGASLGLCIGTKFVALTFGMLLVLPFAYLAVRGVLRGEKHRIVSLFVVAGLGLVTGGFWYVRNWIVTANPLFPLDLPVLFEGIYCRAAMLTSPFHIPTRRFALPVWINAYGIWMAVAAVIGWIGAVVLVIRGRYRGFNAYVVFLPLLITLLHFLLVPYNSQFRFLLPAVLLSYFSFGDLVRLPGVKWPIRIGLLLLVAASLLGLGRNLRLFGFPVSNPPLLPFEYLLFTVIPLAAAVVLFAIAVRLRIAPVFRALLLFPILVVLNFLLIPAISQNAPRQIVAVRANASPSYPIDAWAWVNRLGPGARIAYAGNNVPYHLMGRSWQHRAYYVNDTGSPDALYHDFFAQCRARGSCPNPQLTDKPSGLWRSDDIANWMQNLQTTQTDFLFVARLELGEAVVLSHDGAGFPSERSWADAHPDIFQPVYILPAVRIYRIHRQELAKWLLKEESTG